MESPRGRSREDIRETRDLLTAAVARLNRIDSPGPAASTDLDEGVSQRRRPNGSTGQHPRPLTSHGSRPNSLTTPLPRPLTSDGCGSSRSSAPLPRSQTIDCHRQSTLSLSSRRDERRELFRPRPYNSSWQGRGRKGPSKRKITMWHHDFICLASTGQDTPPSPMDRALLMQAGLGLKHLSFPECSNSEMIHQDLVEAFPKLKEAGGFEFLRSSMRSSKILDVIPLPPSGYSVTYLKSIAGQAKIYLRPIQENLSLAAPQCSDVVSISFAGSY